jgi:hypothetical protein
MVLFVAAMILGSTVNAYSTSSISLAARELASVNPTAREIVKDVKTKLCLMTDAEILSTGLISADVRKAREFCLKSDQELLDYFTQMLVMLPPGTQAAYSCGGKTGIPNYSNLSLSSSSCSWHDPNPFLCKVEGGIACLWGCTNNDPLLGWHTKSFTSTTALQNAIISKGYHLVPGQYGGSYRRGLQYGYSYQVHQISGNMSTGNGTWHSEGPEPDTEPNWPGILGGWYPNNAQSWHNTC